VISDRFYGGGLNTGRNALDGAFLSPGNQTQFFVGDVNVTMPNGGTPYLFPTLLFWNRADVAAGMMPVDMNVPGLAISMQPVKLGSSWTTVIEGDGAGGGMVGHSRTSVAPPIERLQNASHAGLFVSGPLSPRAGLSAVIDWSGSSQLERTGASQADGQAASVFANLVCAPSAGFNARSRRTRSPSRSCGRRSRTRRRSRTFRRHGKAMHRARGRGACSARTRRPTHHAISRCRARSRSSG
jgi:hypothetical protein